MIFKLYKLSHLYWISAHWSNILKLRKVAMLLIQIINLTGSQRFQNVFLLKMKMKFLKSKGLKSMLLACRSDKGTILNFTQLKCHNHTMLGKILKIWKSWTGENIHYTSYWQVKVKCELCFRKNLQIGNLDFQHQKLFLQQCKQLVQHQHVHLQPIQLGCPVHHEMNSNCPRIIGSTSF